MELQSGLAVSVRCKGGVRSSEVSVKRGSTVLYFFTSFSLQLDAF